MEKDVQLICKREKLFAKPANRQMEEAFVGRKGQFVECLLVEWNIIYYLCISKGKVECE